MRLDVSYMIFHHQKLSHAKFGSSSELVMAKDFFAKTLGWFRK